MGVDCQQVLWSPLKHLSVDFICLNLLAFSLYFWGLLFVKNEISASLWGLLLTSGFQQGFTRDLGLLRAQNVAALLTAMDVVVLELQIFFGVLVVENDI